MKLKQLIKSAKAGDTEAQYDIGQLHSLGAPLGTDVNEAVKWFMKARENNHVESIYNLGIIYMFENEFRDVKMANKYFEEAAKLGHDASCYNLALNYLTGTGLPQSGEMAKHWFEQAELNGNKVATFMLSQQKNNPDFYKRTVDS